MKTTRNTLLLCLLAATSVQGQVDKFVRLADLDTTFRYDMKYATRDNFLRREVYPCAECLVRKKVAKALIKANKYFKDKGLRIVFFDCYRPMSVQEKMWAIYADPKYVADPQKGSVHNRGAAVDITLVRENGDLLDMGTDFDHFDIEAHHGYQNLPADVLANRLVLKLGMEQFGFEALATEWWHYKFKRSRNYPLSDFPLPCSED
ncbi:MAG: M15 family metallopeptidase [Bacteroidota bacterium]